MGRASTRKRSSRSVNVHTPRTADLPALTGLPDEPNVRPVSAATGFGFWGSGSGYNGADTTGSRGFVYFPEQDTRKEVTPYTHGELRRRARYLVANVGLAGRFAQAIPRLVLGTGMMPQPGTADKEWNKLAKARFDARAGNALTYCLDGKADFYSDQLISYGASIVDGDMFKVKALDDAGARTLAHYESHQCANGPLAAGDDGRSLYNGIRVNRHNRMISACFTDPGQAGRVVEIPAENLIHVCRHFRHGPARPVSRFHRAVNHMLDSAEVIAAFKGSIKTSAEKGYYISKTDNAKVPHGWGVTTGPTANPMSRQNVTMPDGSTKKVTLEQVLTAPGQDIPDLPPGFDLKLLTDSRPHPNATAFLDYLVRDMSWGFDLAPEIIWSIANIGRSNTYLVMADAQSFVEVEQQNYVDQVAGHEWMWVVQGEMMAGRLRQCQDPEWWKHAWIPPARWTLNKGSDGKLYLDQIRSGALTFRRYFGWDGMGLEQIDEWLDEVQHVRDGCRSRFLDTEGQPDPKMEQFVLQAIYQRVGLASSFAPAAALAEEQADADSKKDDDETKKDE
jgi:hypothetical protein